MHDRTPANGFPELTWLGRQIEMLRIGRGVSKQLLARHAGTSRQQLWRVMTGKSDLTSSLRHRLAQVLQVDAAALAAADVEPRASRTRQRTGRRTPAPLPLPAPVVPDQTRVAASRGGRAPAAAIDAYLADCHAIARTLTTMPDGPEGRRLKRGVLNTLEELAADRGVRLAAPFFELRGRVINDEA